MKLLPFCGLAAALAFTTACQVPDGPRANHWNIESLGPRVTYNFLGYRADRDGTYREFQWQQKQDINLTIRRHLFNDNPDNPFQHPHPEAPPERMPNSVLPDPITFFHADSLAWGGVVWGATGSFVPIPVAGLLGVFEKGGFEEFGEGFGTIVTGSYNSEVAPPDPSEFRVRHTGIVY